MIVVDLPDVAVTVLACLAALGLASLLAPR